MRSRTRRLCVVMLVAVASIVATPSKAETGLVRVVFNKAGVVVGAGRGRGMLTLRGHRYPFKIAGLSLGFTFGASSSELVGKAMNLIAPSDIAGSYGAMGAGAAVAAGLGSVQLRNERGVILQLHGLKKGLEVSAAVSGVRVSME